MKKRQAKKSFREDSGQSVMAKIAGVHFILSKSAKESFIPEEPRPINDIRFTLSLEL
jgi:hypothetical protein